jgi:outer membrane protein TolC
VIALLVTACSSIDIETNQQMVIQQALAQSTDVAARWNQAIAEGHVTTGWLETFGNEKLQKIVLEILNNNRSLAGAAANVQVAVGLAK